MSGSGYGRSARSTGFDQGWDESQSYPNCTSDCQTVRDSWWGREGRGGGVRGERERERERGRRYVNVPQWALISFF